MPNVKTVLRQCRQISALAALFLIVAISLKAQELPFYNHIESEIWNYSRYSTSVSQIKDNIVLNNYTSANVPQQLIYYKGVGYCADQKLTKGINNFDWILSNFNMSTRALELIKDQKSKCYVGSNHNNFSRLYGDANYTDVVAFVVEVSQPRITANTKGGNVRWDDAKITKVEPDEFVGEEPVTEKSLAKWLPSDNSTATIKKNLGLRLSREFDSSSIHQSDNFILIDFGAHSESAIKKRLADLEKSFEYIASYYGLATPEYKMTIYVVDDRNTFKQLGTKLHGLKLSDHLLGYSVDPDLSIVAYTPSFYTGTMKHEMTHLLINSNYGAMAPWLAEGIPAIYEVSEWKSRKLEGVDNWRGNILTEAITRERNTKLSALLGYNWLEFNGHTPAGLDKIGLSINHAMARYFCLYLNEKGKLIDVLNDFSKRDPDEIAGSIAENAIDIVEQNLDSSIDNIERDFLLWFGRFR